HRRPLSFRVRRFRLYPQKGSARLTLNHINLTVDDVPAAKKFLAKYFALRDQMPESKNKTIGFVFDDNGMVITLIKAEKGENVTYPSSFHIGFMQATPDDVNRINQQLKADGYDVEPPSRQHGAWTFYFTAPGGFLIEVLS